MKVQFSVRTLMAVMFAVGVFCGLRTMTFLSRPSFSEAVFYYHCIPPATAAAMGLAVAVYRSENYWRRATLAGGACAGIAALVLYCEMMGYVPWYYASPRPWHWWLSDPGMVQYCGEVLVFHASVGNIAGFTAGQLAWWTTGRESANE